MLTFVFTALFPPKTILLDVTPGDIARGLRGSAESCALARSLRRQGYRGVRVGETTCVSTFFGDRLYLLDEAGKEFVRVFDYRGRSFVIPQQFVLTRV